MKQSNLFYTALLIFTLSHWAVGQQYTRYQGVVFNGSDSSRLPFVHVHIEETSMGVSTNSAGQFQINVHDSLANKNIVFSCIGFENLTLPLKEAFSHERKYDSIFLHPDIFILHEVVITAPKDTLGAFLQKVIDRIEINYPTKAYFLSGFYREISQMGDASSRLIEAAVSIQDPGYAGNDNKLRIRVDQMRKSDDFISYSWTRSLNKLMFGDKNDLIQTYRTDFLRESVNLTRNGGIFKYELRLDTLLGTGKNQVAKIVFYSNEMVNAPYFMGEIYVSLSDLAIKRMSYSWVAHPKFTFGRQDLIFYDGLYRFKKVVEYQKIGSKYYPFFISSFEPIPGVTAAKGKLQFKESTILINQVFLDKKEYSKIKRREREREGRDIYEQDFPYDANFWEEYNMVILNPIGDNQRFSLEKKDTLEKQFRKNAQ